MNNENALVLVVDDDESMLEVLTSALQSLGCSVHALENTYLAKNWLSTHRPDLILVDIMMPDGNGLDFCRWIQSNPALKNPPIIVISGLAEEEMVQDALELGAAHFFRKPMSMDAIKKKITQILASRPRAR
jgi:CheY-like chemotaxis protein